MWLRKGFLRPSNTKSIQAVYELVLEAYNCEVKTPRVCGNIMYVGTNTLLFLYGGNFYRLTLHASVATVRVTKTKDVKQDELKEYTFKAHLTGEQALYISNMIIKIEENHASKLEITKE